MVDYQRGLHDEANAQTEMEAGDEYARDVEERINSQLERHREQTPDHLRVDQRLESGRAVSNVGSTYLEPQP